MASDRELPELRFVRPVPGFGDLGRCVLIQLGTPEDDNPDDDHGGPLYELRSLDRPEVSFLVAVPSAFFPDYTIDLDEAACADLELDDPSDALVLVVLTVGADVGTATANLLAPVVINARLRTAAQVILSGTDWPVRAAVV